MSVCFDKWIQRMASQDARGRVICNTKMIIPFDAREVSRYTDTMLRTIAGVEKKSPSSLGPRGKASASAVALATTTNDDAGGDSGGGGAGDEGDGDGDGDGDGPRRKLARRRKSPRVSAARRRSRPPSTSPPDRAHAHALIAFTLVTAMVLGTALAFGLNGQPELAERTLGLFDSIASVATALLLPK